MARSVKSLHESFIEQAKRPMMFGKLPVSVKEAEAPVIAVERWKVDEHTRRLTKKFQFRRLEDRNNFVQQMMTYELEIQHHARITIEEDNVTIEVVTKDVERITEIDREFATYADVVFKDVVYAIENRQDFIQK